MFEPKLFIRYRSKSLRNLTLVKAVPKFARSENFSYLAVGYLKCGIFVQLTENKPLPFRYLLSYTAYLHHWLSVTIHFNRYNHSFDKCTECRDKCKPLYFIALHIRVVPPLFSLFVECPLSDTRCWVIGHFRRCVTERLLNTKVVVFLGFLWFAWTFSSKEVDLQ